MRGRKPVPSALKRLRGNPGKRAAAQEPEFAAQIPPCPDHLTEAARAEWERIAGELHEAGLLTGVDRAALACYCQAWARLAEAEAKVLESGAVIEKDGKEPYQNPWLFVANRAMAQVRAFAAEFGMTPSARSRVKGRQKEQDSPMAKLLKARRSAN